MTRRRYYRNYQKEGAAVLVAFIFGGIFLIFKGIFKLFSYAFSGNTETKNSFKLNEATINAPVGQIIDSQTENVGQRYGLRDSLITPAEKNFLQALQQAVGDLYRIELQVQLSRIVSPLDANVNYVNYRDFNRIKAKSIDFVLFDKEYKPYLCIELDDRSHLRFDRIQRDIFVDQIMKGVGLRILHIPAAYSYDVEKLRKQIFPIPFPSISNPSLKG